jgi:hypothetical protein
MAKRQRPAAKNGPAQKSRQKSGPPAGPDKRGCASSFLMARRDEMDKECGNLKLDDEYAQPDEEKELGGEG